MDTSDGGFPKQLNAVVLNGYIKINTFQNILRKQTTPISEFIINSRQCTYSQELYDLGYKDNIQMTQSFLDYKKNDSP